MPFLKLLIAQFIGASFLFYKKSIMLRSNSRLKGEFFIKKATEKQTKFRQKQTKKMSTFSKKKKDYIYHPYLSDQNVCNRKIEKLWSEIQCFPHFICLFFFICPLYYSMRLEQCVRIYRSN